MLVKLTNVVEVFAEYEAVYSRHPPVNLEVRGPLH